MAAGKVRIDKWLWAARFFKTRNLAIEAINGGKIHVDGQRIKPAKAAVLYQTVRIRISHVERTVIIQALSDKRGSAPIAQQLYRETEESIEQREKAKSLHHLANAARERGTGRPTKRDRRSIQQFKKCQS